MTIKRLKELCEMEIEHGRGNNKIVLCVRTDEFYALEGGFSKPIENDSAVYDFIEAWDVNEERVSVLN